MFKIENLFLLCPDTGLDKRLDVNVTAESIHGLFRMAMPVIQEALTAELAEPNERVILDPLSKDDLYKLSDGHLTIKRPSIEHYGLYYDAEAENEESLQWAEENWEGQLDIYTADRYRTLIVIYKP